MNLRLRTDLSFVAGYLHVSSRVTDAGGTPLQGLQLPQIPRDQFNFQAVYTRANFGTLSFQLRASGAQFEDDLNTLPLKRFTAADVYFSHFLSERFSIYAAIENLTNSRIEAGRTPVITLGQPRAVRFGIRFRSKE